ncbi:NTF2 fold immunity protein [Escherichia coli]|uniref:NTF2 fold immunity protein n=1 Tax=Escherichia coli TaxID=562 RepID=UPI0022C61F76|nr:NTF2 fold immunity protein [Escherichia coli]MCZ5904275.1 NTF2 fold immunity protein [Escherichia coli]
MALELSYVYIKYVYGKEKAEFQKPYSITDDNNCWKIEGKQPKTLGGNFTILIAKKRWASVACNTHKIIHCTVDSNILPRCVS